MLRATAPNKGKGNAGAKTAADGMDGEVNIVYDCHEGSVHDLMLHVQVLQGYEEFKVCIIVSLAVLCSSTLVGRPYNIICFESLPIMFILGRQI
jgi:hypothetical protein